jgi:hypothetical protein
LTNAVYDVQYSTNLSRWATLEKISSATTNFSYTDLVPAVARFYRLVVP